MMTCFNHVQSSRNCLNTLPSARVHKVNVILEFSNLDIFNPISKLVSNHEFYPQYFSLIENDGQN